MEQDVVKEIMEEVDEGIQKQRRTSDTADHGRQSWGLRVVTPQILEVGSP